MERTGYGRWKLKRGVKSDHRIPRKYVCIKCRKAVLSTNTTLPTGWLATNKGCYCYDCKNGVKGYK